MSLKNQKKFAIMWMTVGVALWIAALVPEWENDYYSGMTSGMAGCFLVIGVVRLVRVRRWQKDPEKAADYEAALKDERTAYVSNKARSMTFVVSIYVQLAVGLLSMYVFDQMLLGQVLCYLTCFQCLLFTILFRVYNKRY